MAAAMGAASYLGTRRGGNARFQIHPLVGALGPAMMSPVRQSTPTPTNSEFSPTSTPHMLMSLSNPLIIESVPPGAADGQLQSEQKGKRKVARAPREHGEFEEDFVREETTESSEDVANVDDRISSRTVTKNSGSGDCTCKCSSLKEAIESTIWQGVVMSVICFNVFVMALECDNPDDERFDPIEHAFLVFFVLEVSIRLYVYRCSFFTDPDEKAWNWFDLIVVLIGVLDQWVMSLLFSGSQGGSAMTTLRIFRVLRIFRSLRIVRHMTQLRLLIQGFADSLQAVIWIFILFLFIVFFAGIFVTTLIGHNAGDWCEDEELHKCKTLPEDDMEYPDCCEDVAEIEDCFGTLPQSMFTMFRFVTLDDWAAVTMTVTKKMPLMAFFFVVYMLITAYAVIALLTGVMAERVSCRTQENEKNDELQNFKDWVLSKEKVFRESSPSVDDEPVGLTFDEMWNNEEFDLQKIIDQIQGDRAGGDGICKEDVEDLFKALDLSGDGLVSWDEFKYGMKHIYGDASARDIAILRADVNRVLHRLTERDGVVHKGADPWERKAESMELRMKRIEGLLRELMRGLVGEPPSN